MAETDEIVQRLRAEHGFRFGGGEDGGEAPSLYTEAADEIERLRVIERAARLHVDAAYREHGSVVGGTLTALRVALTGRSEHD